MTEFLIANLAPIMFGALIVFLLMGFPVAFSLAACGLFFGFVGIELGTIIRHCLQSLPLRMFGIMQNDTLLAIPFFTFMGLILERSGMAEDLLDTIGQLFGPIRGGLAFAVILVGAHAGGHHRRGGGLGDLDGPDLAAHHAALWLRPARRHRRDCRLRHAGADHSALAGADHPGRPAWASSVGDMYKGAFIPGFVLTGLYVGYVLLVSLITPDWVPALPAEARTIREDDGTSGLRSLGMLTVLSVIAAVAFAKTPRRCKGDGDWTRNHRGVDVRGCRRGLPGLQSSTR